MTKIVVNKCYGGFGVSNEVLKYIFERLSDDKKQQLNNSWQAEAKRVSEGFPLCDKWTILEEVYYSYVSKLPRHDKLLIEAIENVVSPDGDYSSLQIVEIEDDKYIIKEYDGYESVTTPSSISWVEI